MSAKDQIMSLLNRYSHTVDSGDLDGFVNAIEFVLASIPTTPGSVPSVEPVIIDGAPGLVFVQRPSFRIPV